MITPYYRLLSYLGLDPTFKKNHCIYSDDFYINISDGKANTTFTTEYVSVIFVDKTTQETVAELNTDNAVLAYNYLLPYI